jgi:hypothetical protein
MPLLSRLSSIWRNIFRKARTAFITPPPCKDGDRVSS